MIKFKLHNIFKSKFKRQAPVSVSLVLSNAITMQATHDGGKLKLR
jgi:hypothetical protein